MIKLVFLKHVYAQNLSYSRAVNICGIQYSKEQFNKFLSKVSPPVFRCYEQCCNKHPFTSVLTNQGCCRLGSRESLLGPTGCVLSILIDVTRL